MSDPSHALVGTTPYVWVKDVHAALPYYTDVLGFEVEFQHDYGYDGKQFGLACIVRDEVQLQLQVCECPDERHTGLSFFRMQVQGLNALHDEWAAKGAIIRFPPTDQDWGVRDFQIDDPEGNRIYLYEWRV